MKGATSTNRARDEAPEDFFISDTDLQKITKSWKDDIASDALRNVYKMHDYFYGADYIDASMYTEVAYKYLYVLISHHRDLDQEIQLQIHQKQDIIDQVLYIGQKILQIFQAMTELNYNRPIEITVQEVLFQDLQNIVKFIYSDLMKKNENLACGVSALEKDKFVEKFSAELQAGLDRFADDESDRLNIVAKIVKNCKISLNSLQDQSEEILPSSPPNGETYDTKPLSENALEFIRRVYGGWLKGQFTRADLRKIDPKAEMALRNWEKKHGRAPLNLPTKKERNDRLLAESNLESKPEAVKLYDALRARRRRERKITP